MIRPRNLKRLALVLAFSGSSLAVLSSCSSGKVANPHDNTGTVNAKVNAVYFDDLGIVPTDAVGSNFILRLNNTYDERLRLDSINVLDPVTKKINNSLGRVSRGNCAQVAANNYCSINYSSNLTKNGSFIIEAKLTNTATGEKLTRRQFVRVGRVNGVNGLEFQAMLDEVGAINRRVNMSLPVYVSSEGLKELKADDSLSGELKCNGDVTKGNTACTYLINENVLEGRTALRAQVKGLTKSGAEVSQATNTVATTHREGHLLISIPNHIDLNKVSAGKNDTYELTVYNNGTNDVQAISADAYVGDISGNGITITSQGAEACSKDMTLTSGNSCTIGYKVDRSQIKANSVANVTVNYQKLKGENAEVVDTLLPVNFLMTWTNIINPGLVDEGGKPITDPNLCKPPIGTGVIDCKPVNPDDPEDPEDPNTGGGGTNQGMKLNLVGTPGDLNASLVNVERTVLYTLSNPSPRAINDIEINVTKSPADNSFTLKEPTGSCKVGPQKFTLASGESCTFKGSLKEQKTGKGSAFIYVAGKYVDALNPSMMVDVSQSFMTMFTADSALKLFTIDPADKLLSIPVGGTKVETYTIKNTSANSFGFNGDTLELTPTGNNAAMAQDLLDDKKLRIKASTNANKCNLTRSNIIPAGKSCEFEIEYKPTKTTDFKVLQYDFGLYLKNRTEDKRLI